MEASEDKADAAAVAEFHEDYRSGREFLVPAKILRRELAAQAGISKPYLSQIESGKRQGTVETLAAIARALDVPLEVLT